MEHQDVEQMRQMAEVMKALHAVPVAGISGSIGITMVLFDQNIFLNIPRMPGHAMPPVQHILIREGLAGHPGPCRLMIACGTRPRFYALHKMEPGPPPSPGLRIFPLVLDVVGPPEGLPTMAVLILPGVFGFDPVLASGVVLPRGKIAVFEDDQ